MLEFEYRLCRKFGYRFCVENPNTEPYLPSWGLGDGEVARNDGRSFQSGCKIGSGRFAGNDDIDPSNKKAATLCEVDKWWQGDYAAGRYVRKNDDSTSYVQNYSKDNFFDGFGWDRDVTSPAAEGIYACHNFGSCVAPDICSCPDGYTGFDCSRPLCRHRQVTGEVVSCMNGGFCKAKDTCSCPRFFSRLHRKHKGIRSGWTGFNGTDCSIPMCKQGVFDPLCQDVTSGGEGCFRCKNGGNCTSPDVCTCAPGWTGVDCSTPVCTMRVDAYLLVDVQTFDENRVREIELDPCQFAKQQGNCTAPGICTCKCFERSRLLPNGYYEYLPWSDPFGRLLPYGFIYGTKSCRSGFEGIKDKDTGLFKTCHLRIYEPTWFERYSMTILVCSSIVVFCSLWGYLEAKRNAKRQLLLAKAARKRKLDEEDVSLKRRRRRQKQGTAKKKTRHTRRKAV